MEAFRSMTEDGEIGVSSAAFILHTSRSSFQYVKRPPCRRLRADEQEKKAIAGKLAGEHITYGYRRIWALLRRQGVFISRNRVRRISPGPGCRRRATLFQTFRTHAGIRTSPTSTQLTSAPVRSSRLRMHARGRYSPGTSSCHAGRQRRSPSQRRRS